jgi:hypothetical protein
VLDTPFDIQFDEPSHTYTLDGKPVSSVTRIIELAHDFRFVKQADLDRASDAGKKVHKTIELAEQGRLNEDTLHPFLANHLKWWRKFKDDFKFDPIAFEVRVASRKFQYAGTLDVHGLLLPRTDFDEVDALLLDVKTGLEYPAHKLQTAGYANAGVEMGILPENIKRACLYLSEDGYEIVWHTSMYDGVAFISLNNFNYWKKHHGQTRNA